MPNKEPPKEHQFKPGETGNAGGRPKDSIKSFLANKLAKMTDKQKEAWLKRMKIGGELQWKMAEGNPTNEIDHGIKLTTIEQIFDKIEKENEQEKQKMEDTQPIQD